MLNLYPPSCHDSYKIQRACEKIKDACAGEGSKKEILTSILGPKTPNERYLISVHYKEIFGKDLKDEIQDETHGDFRYLLKLLCMPLPDAEAEILHHASKGMGTREKYIYPVLVGRTRAEMEMLKDAYKKNFEKELDERMESEFSGDLEKVILGSIRGGVPEFNPEEHTDEKAEADAEALYEAGEAHFGTDEDKFIELCLSMPPQHMRNVNVLYEQKHGHSIARAVEKEFHRDTEDALLFLVRMTLEPLDLLAEHFEKTMKYIGTDENALSASLVRYLCVLPDISEAYEKKYGKSLRDRIDGDTSGAYCDLLLEVYDSV